MTFLHSLVLHWGGPQHWNGELFLSQLGVQQTIKSAIEHIETRSYSNHKHVYMVNCRFIHNENSLTLSSRDSHVIPPQCHSSPSFLPSLIHSPPMSLLSFLLPSLLSPLSPLSSLPSGEQHGQSSHPLILLWIRDGVKDDARLVLLHQLKRKLQVCKVGIIQSYKLASLSVCG